MQSTRIKQLLLIFSFIFITIHTATSTFASNLESPEATTNQISVDSSDTSDITESDEPITIKIGYVMNYGTIKYPVVSGSRGYGYDYFTEISKYCDGKYNFEYVSCKYDEALSLLQKGVIDVWGPIQFEEDLDELFCYPTHDFGFEEIVLHALKDDDTAYNDYDKIKNSIIATEETNLNLSLLEKFCTENNLNPTIINSTSNNNVDNMEAGLYDYHLSSSLKSEAGLKIVANLGVTPIYYITRLEDQALMDDINNALIAIEEDNYLFNNNLYSKYSQNSSIAAPLITDAELALLQSGSPYTVGYSTFAPPIAYTNAQGNPAGLSIDIMNQIASLAGITFHYVPIDADNRDSSQGLDINLAMVHASNDSFGCILSDPYLELPLVLIQPMDSTTSHSVVGIVDYNSIDASDIMDYYDYADMKIYNEYESLYTALESNEIEAMILSNVAANLAMQNLRLDDYFMKPLDVTLNLQLHFNPEFDSHKIDIINRLIATIDDETINAFLLKNAQTEDSPLTTVEFIQLYFLQIITILVIVFITILTIITILVRRKRIALLKLIDYDTLTGLLSEERFSKDTISLIKSHPNTTYSIIVMDIDNFKYVNEAYGYERGTLALLAISKELPNIFPNSCLIARPSSDNFYVLIQKNHLRDHDIFDPNKMHTIFETILGPIIGKQYRMMMSLGIYHVTDPNLDIDYMIDCANLAKYHGKDNYGFTTITFSAAMNNNRNYNNTIIARMEDAILNKEFHMVYQPKVNLSTRRIVGAEALVRWTPKDENPIFPDQFIPIFEQNGFITTLDYYVIEEVCTFMPRILDKNLLISINLSGLTLLQKDMISSILKIVDQYEIPHEFLEFEITESAIISQLDHAMEQIHALKEHGFSVSMDDFGSGISSLNRLKDIDIDILKIDKAFLNNSLNQARGITIVENIVAMANQLEIETVAEGVETEEHVNLLTKFNCTIAQGYYFSRPVWEDDFIKLL